MDTLLQDLRFALRSFRRSPAFPLAAITTLALGIGATTAIFSTLNAVLLKPLPYPQAENLYNIRTRLTDGRVTTGMLSNGELSRLSDAALPIVRAAGMQSADLTLLHEDGTPQHVKIYGVTEGFFELFGLPMTLGGFVHENFVPPAPPAPNAPPARNAPPLVVISYRVWQDLYHGDAQIVGKPIRFAEVATTIAGVAPRDFDTPHGGDFWFSQQLGPDDINHFFDGYMRLKPGVTMERATAAMEPVMKGLERDFPASDLNRAYVVKPLVASVVGDLGPILIIVMSATSLLLLLACVNVTNLLLARGAARAREMARAGGARRAPQPPDPAAAHRVGDPLGCRRRAGRGPGGARGTRAARARRVAAAASRRRDVRWARAALRAGHAGGERTAGRLRAGAAAGGHGRAHADEREHAFGHRRARHRPLAEHDDGRRDRAGDHARRRGRAGWSADSPTCAARIWDSSPRSGCCSTSRSSGRSIPTGWRWRRPPARSRIGWRPCRASPASDPRRTFHCATPRKDR